MNQIKACLPQSAAAASFRIDSFNKYGLYPIRNI